jgi:hypothetical protein
MEINNYDKKTKISSEDYYYSPMEKESLNEFNGAIEEYTNATINDRSFKPAYIGRTLLKRL